MTAVSRAAEAPRAASSISSSSIRWCCTGGTSGCTMNTSASRQLASSCTPRQSLLNVDVVEGLSGIFRRLQIARASSGYALPLKMTILFMRGEHHTRHFELHFSLLSSQFSLHTCCGLGDRASRPRLLQTRRSARQNAPPAILFTVWARADFAASSRGSRRRVLVAVSSRRLLTFAGAEASKRNRTARDPVVHSFG